ncbi:MAG: hypothetical protein RLZZ135_1476 [Cyanobacteriota bacterium]
MNLPYRLRQSLTALVLVCILAVTSACNSATVRAPQASAPSSIDRSIGYGQLARGNTDVGQEFGTWAVEASKGLIKDVFVRDNNKLGTVISPQVRPNEVKDLAQSLAQGFRKSFPDRDLSVLMYAPDKQLILTARYDAQSKQIEYQAAS